MNEVDVDMDVMIEDTIFHYWSESMTNAVHTVMPVRWNYIFEDEENFQSSLRTTGLVRNLDPMAMFQADKWNGTILGGQLPNLKAAMRFARPVTKI